MTKAAFWSSEQDPLLEVAFDIFGTCPLDDDTVEEFCKEAADQEDTRLDVQLLVFLEQELEVEIPDAVCEAVWSEEGLTFAALREGISGFSKMARITTPEERARSIAYRAAHKEEIKRKSRKRRTLQRKGLVTKMRRIGTAATGYTFVPDTKGVEGTGKAGVGGLAREFNFSPTRDESPKEERSSLRWR